MTSIRGLYERFRLLIHEGFKFLVIGAIGTAITIGGAIALNEFNKYVAITIATVAGTIAAFLGNRYWTFRHRQGRGTAHESTMFFLLNGVGLLIYYACIWIIQDIAGLSGRAWYSAALVVGTALGTVFRFWSYRKWVWHDHGHPAVTGADLPGHLDLVLAGGGPVGDFAAGHFPVSGAAVRSAPAREPLRRGVARHAAARAVRSGPAPAGRRRGAHRRT